MRLAAIGVFGPFGLPVECAFLYKTRRIMKYAGPAAISRESEAGKGRRGERTMQSESARMSSAAEAKFRIDRPNSRPRAVKVIALDAASERVVKDLAGGPWQNATFLTASAFSGAPRRGEKFSMGGWLNDL